MSGEKTESIHLTNFPEPEFINDKIEEKSCEICDESWVCSSWSSCSAGKETRTCLDEHSCGTALYHPIEQRSCVSASGASTSFQQQSSQQSFSSTPSPLFSSSHTIRL